MLEKSKFIPSQEATNNPEEERKSLEEMNRREFLRKLGMGLTVLGLGGVEAVLSSGCASSRIGLKSEEIRQRLESFYRKIEDPNGYLNYLEECEFVVKNEIFDSYARTVDKRPEWLVSPAGGYMSRNYLDKKEEAEEFRERLAKLGLQQDEIKFYELLFSSSDLIILRESVLEEDFFLTVLPHERFHKAMKRLSNDEYRMMMQAAQDIMDRADGQKHFVKERYYKGKNSVGFYIAAASMNWEEFYTYLAQGEFDDSVEQALKTDFPEQYRIFSEIRESCRLKEQK